MYLIHVTHNSLYEQNDNGILWYYTICHTSILYIHYVYSYLLLVLCRREGGDSIVIFFLKLLFTCRMASSILL